MLSDFMSMAKNPKDTLIQQEIDLIVNILLDYVETRPSGFSWSGELVAALKQISEKLNVKPADLFIYINDQYVRFTGKEFVAIGCFCRTFVFWTMDERREYIQDNLQLIKNIENKFPNVFCSYGTTLAAVRDGVFIPHDIDIDLSVIIPANIETNRIKATEIVREYLHSLGYKTEMSPNKCNIHIEYKDEKFFDLWVGVENGDFVNWHPSPKNIIRIDEIFPLRHDYTLEGIAIPIPNNFEAYLEKLYGKTWRIPDSGFRSGKNYLELEQ